MSSPNISWRVNGRAVRRKTGSPACTIFNRIVCAINPEKSLGAFQSVKIRDCQLLRLFTLTRDNLAHRLILSSHDLAQQKQVGEQCSEMDRSVQIIN